MNDKGTNQTLHIVCGQPGAGKTTFGKELALKNSAFMLDIDVATENLVRAGLACAGKDPNDRDSGEFKAAFREPIHATLFAIARENLSSGDVVICAPFSQELQKSDWLDWLQENVWMKVEIYLIVCDEQVLYQRIKERANPRDAAKLLNWQEYRKRYTWKRPVFPHMLIDTTDNTPDLSF